MFLLKFKNFHTVFLFILHPFLVEAGPTLPLLQTPLTQSRITHTDNNFKLFFEFLWQISNNNNNNNLAYQREEPTHDVGGHYAKVVHLLHLGSQGDCEALLRNKTLLPVPIRQATSIEHCCGAGFFCQSRRRHFGLAPASEDIPVHFSVFLNVN